MTSTARRDVPPIRLSIRSVTTKTGDMSIESRRNREPNATTISPVTRCTRRIAVFRVIELRIETAQRRKRFDLSALGVRVTDRADLARGIHELLCVTTRARCMRSFAGQGRLR